MAKSIITGNKDKKDRHNPERKIDFGPLRYMIDKYRSEDVPHVVYKLSYAGNYIYIKGKSLAGSLIILVDTLVSFRPGSDRFKNHLYTHWYKHLEENNEGRFRIQIINSAPVNGSDNDFYELLKAEQNLLDASRYDPACLNNQTEVYIPLYNESTGKYGWLPKSSVMSFNRWLGSDGRKGLLQQYGK